MKHADMDKAKCTEFCNSPLLQGNVPELLDRSGVWRLHGGGGGALFKLPDPDISKLHTRPLVPMILQHDR